MRPLDFLLDDPRLTIRRAGQPDPEGRCVIYWMQRAQRAADNAALTAAIEAGNGLGRPVVVFFQLVPHSHHANFRHYQFLVEGLKDIAAELKRRRVGLVVRRYPQHGLLRFCSEVRPCLVIGDENPMKEAELTKSKIAQKIALPFWTVDADVIVPSRLLPKSITQRGQSARRLTLYCRNSCNRRETRRRSLGGACPSDSPDQSWT